MNWDMIATIAEILAALGVVASLLYLARELALANKLAKRNAVQSVIAARSEFSRFVSSDPELSNLFWNGVDAPDKLDEAEWNRFMAIVSSLVRNFEAIFVDRKAGLISDEVWHAQESSIMRWMSKPGLQKYLSEFKSDYESEFVHYVSTRCLN